MLLINRYGSVKKYFIGIVLFPLILLVAKNNIMVSHLLEIKVDPGSHKSKRWWSRNAKLKVNDVFNHSNCQGNIKQEYIYIDLYNVAFIWRPMIG